MKQKIRRINELSRKAKVLEGLTEEEIKERTLLRHRSMAAVRMNLCAAGSYHIADEQGNKQKLQRKKRTKAVSSYDYGHNTPDDAPWEKQTESEILSWLLIFFCFVVFWPLGLFLLIRKLSGDKRKRRSKCSSPRSWCAAGMVCACAAGMAGNRAGGSADAQYTLGKERDPLGIETGRRVLAFGASRHQRFYRYDWRTDLLASPAWTAGCVVLFGAGVLMLGKGLPWIRRPGVMPGIWRPWPACSPFLCPAFRHGLFTKRVEEDLDHMIGQGYFGPTAYLDLSLGYFSAAVRLRRKLRGPEARGGRYAERSGGRICRRAAFDPPGQ